MPELSPRKINRISLLLLALGFGSALIIYRAAEPTVFDPLLGDPMADKKFIHELQVFGGKTNVLAVEFIQWFESLWHGERLAGTVAVLTVVVTLGFRFVAARPDLYAPTSVSNETSHPPP